MGDGQYLVQFFMPMSASQAFNVAAQLENDAEIEYASPDLWKYPTLTPNDTCYPTNTNPACFNSAFSYFMHEWHLMPGGTEVGGANLPPAWDLTTGSASITVGVIDTGYLPNHPDLAGRFVAGYDFIYDFAVANDSQPVQSAALPAGQRPATVRPAESAVRQQPRQRPLRSGRLDRRRDFPGSINSWFYTCADRAEQLARLAYSGNDRRGVEQCQAASRASTGSASCRPCACSASAVAIRPTSSTPSSGVPAVPCPALPPIPPPRAF